MTEAAVSLLVVDFYTDAFVRYLFHATVWINVSLIVIILGNYWQVNNVLFCRLLSKTTECPLSNKLEALVGLI